MLRKPSQHYLMKLNLKCKEDLTKINQLKLTQEQLLERTKIQKKNLDAVDKYIIFIYLNQKIRFNVNDFLLFQKN